MEFADLKTADCGCLFDGTFCPHCGRPVKGNHAARCHGRSLGEIPIRARRATAMDLINAARNRKRRSR